MKNELILNLKKVTFLLFFISVSIYGEEPNPTLNDSLIKIIEATEGKEKLGAILQFCKENNRSLAQQTMTYSSDGIVLADVLEDLNAKAELLRYQGKSAFTLGNMESSKTTFEKAIVLSRSINDSTNLGKCYRSLGTYYFILGNFKESRIQDSLSLIIAEKINNVQMIYDANTDIASSYLGQGMYSKALKLFDKVLAFCRLNQLDCAGTLVNKAIAIHNVGQPSDALSYFFEGRNAFLEKEDYSSAALVEHHIGHLLKQTELYEEALQYYGSVKKFYEKHGNINRLSAIHLSMGELMLKLERLEEAERYLQKALDFKKEKGIKTTGDALIDLGNVALQRKNYELALQYFQRAQKVYEATEDTAGIAAVDNCFSMVYLATGNHKNAEKYALQSLSLNKKSGIKRELVISYENLTEAYEGQDKFDLALQAKKELDTLNLDLNGSKELLAITKKLVIEKLRENEQDHVMDSSNDTEASISNFPIALWFLIVIIVGFFGGGFFYLRLRNQSVSKNTNKVEYLQKEEVSELFKTLKEVVETEKPYLEQELLLMGLAELLNTSEKKLSVLLNHSLSISFYDYINRHRVEAVKEKLELDEYEKYSLLGVAYSCGFNSKSSFYRAFKKETGISPTLYKAQKVS